MMTLLTNSQRVVANKRHTAIKMPLVPRNKTDERAQKILDNLQRVRETRVQNHPLILEDLKELGMYGELSNDQQYVTMSFEDVHRLMTTMKMANVILNERVKDRRRAKIDEIKEELDAEHCPNMQSLLAELLFSPSSTKRVMS